MLLIRILLILFFINITCFAGEFPLRIKYPGLKFIDTNQFKAIFDESIIIDARSKSEYIVIHINKAVNIAVTKQNFSTRMLSMYPNKKTKIVFYCNGHTCSKSYKASKKAKELGYTNTLVYDSGIFEWVQKYPETSSLLGETPVDISKLIPKNKFLEHLITFDEFKKKAIPYKSTIIDIREPYQKFNHKTLKQHRFPKILGVKKISVTQDKLIKNILSKKIEQDRVLLIFDDVGKQVKWLQYYLENNEYKNYYFLKKGIKGIVK